MSCGIISGNELCHRALCYWREELLGFVLKDRCDIHSDLLAVRIICPVSFHKEPKDTKRSPLTKTKPLTWILSLCSFHVRLLSHSLSVVYLSFNLCPSLHTQTSHSTKTCLKRKQIWCKHCSCSLVKNLSASVHRCNVFFGLCSSLSAAHSSLSVTC